MSTTCYEAVKIVSALYMAEHSTLTPRAKYSVKAIEPKYAAVNGRRSVDKRCFTDQKSDNRDHEIPRRILFAILTIHQRAHHDRPTCQE